MPAITVKNIPEDLYKRITKDEPVQKLIYQIRKSLSISNHESLANKLVALFNMAKKKNLPALVFRSTHLVIFMIS